MPTSSSSSALLGWWAAGATLESRTIQISSARSLFRGATGAKPPDYVGSRQIMVTQTSIPATQSFHTVWMMFANNATTSDSCLCQREARQGAPFSRSALVLGGKAGGRFGTSALCDIIPIIIG